jgi:hypothetical protein
MLLLDLRIKFRLFHYLEEICKENNFRNKTLRLESKYPIYALIFSFLTRNSKNNVLVIRIR